MDMKDIVSYLFNRRDSLFWRVSERCTFSLPNWNVHAHAQFYLVPTAAEPKQHVTNTTDGCDDDTAIGAVVALLQLFLFYSAAASAATTTTTTTTKTTNDGVIGPISFFVTDIVDDGGNSNKRRYYSPTSDDVSAAEGVRFQA